MLDFLGWFGALMFALCGIPQALQSYREGHTRGMGWGFLSMWAAGEVSMILYTLPMQNYPLLLNYIGNFVALVVMVYFKVWERPAQISIDWGRLSRIQSRNCLTPGNKPGTLRVIKNPM